MGKESKLTTIKVDQKLFAKLKRMRNEEWDSTGNEPTYQDLIERALNPPDIPEGCRSIVIPEDMVPSVMALMNWLKERKS